MASRPQVLLLGGHGKVAQHFTRILLAKSYPLVSVVRNPDHRTEIESLASGDQQKSLSVLVSSVEDIKSPTDASDLLARTRPSIVIWSAGAGGKGGPSRTKAVDEVAAKHVISAALADPAVKKFLMVSYIASRRGRPPWWDDEDWRAAQHVNQDVLPHYFAAKVEADEYLLALARRRREESGDREFQMINLRPGTLTDDPGTGRISLGKTKSRGKVSREDVARVGVELLERNDTWGYFDLLAGDEDIKEAVERCVREGHDGTVGEDLERIYGRTA